MKPEDIADIVRDHLTAAYVCNRVWEAWSVGTMGQDDFIEASETEMADEIAAAIVARYGHQPTGLESADAQEPDLSGMERAFSSDVIARREERQGLVPAASREPVAEVSLNEERLAMEAVMESVDPATWPGLTVAQRCALGRFAKPQLAESAEPWYGHKYQQFPGGVWKCAEGCGPDLYEHAPVAAQPNVTDEMVNRFLTWPVPANVYPDGTPGQPGRTGTNLLDAIAAREMLEHVLSGSIAAQRTGNTDTCRAALAELVACKDLKDRRDALHDRGPYLEFDSKWRTDLKALQDEYNARKPVAWAAARAALADRLVAQPSVPDGWKLVPVEPTPEMYIRGGEEFFDSIGSCDHDGDTLNDQNRAASIYSGMLAAAPTPPAADQEK